MFQLVLVTINLFFRCMSQKKIFSVLDLKQPRSKTCQTEKENDDSHPIPQNAAGTPNTAAADLPDDSASRVDTNTNRSRVISRAPIRPQYKHEAQASGSSIADSRCFFDRIVEINRIRILASHPVHHVHPVQFRFPGTPLGFSSRSKHKQIFPISPGHHRILHEIKTQARSARAPASGSRATGSVFTTNER